MMKKVALKFCLPILFVWMVSCGDKSKNSSAKIVDLPLAVEVTPEVFDKDVAMTPPVQMFVCSDYLTFMSPGMGRSVLFINKNNKDTYYWGQMGSGPDDFISPKCIAQDGHSMTLYDVNLHKVVKYDVCLEDSIRLVALERQQVQTDSISLIDLHMMDNHYSVGMAGFGCRDMFVLLDSRMKIVNTFGDFPMDGLPKENYLNVYGALASYKNKLFYSCLPAGYVACYNVDDAGNVRKEWERFLTDFRFDSARGRWTEDNRNGIYDMKVTEDYVFLAFSGKSQSEENRLPQNLLILTHEGKLIRNIKCKDKFIGRFAIDGEYVYASALDELIRFNWKNAL